MNQTIYYYNFNVCKDDIIEAKSTKLKKRLECVRYINDSGNHRSLDSFINHKNGIFLERVCTKYLNKSECRRLPEMRLVGTCNDAKSSINLISLFNESCDCPEFYYGNPDSSMSSNNSYENPFHNYMRDGYLFKANKDYTDFEILVLPGQLNNVRGWYQHLIDGKLDKNIQGLRAKAKSLFDYSNLSTSYSNMKHLTNSINYV